MGSAGLHRGRSQRAKVIRGHPIAPAKWAEPFFYAKKGATYLQTPDTARKKQLNMAPPAGLEPATHLLTGLRSWWTQK